MRLLDESAPWLQDLSIAEGGITVGHGGRFGLGAVLVAERERSRELLFVRKAYRPGFAGNDQLAFPGGMIRSSGQEMSLSSRIRISLAARVAAEVHLDLQLYAMGTPLEGPPPVVAAYTAKGQQQHTVILPFVLSLAQIFIPHSQDATVYDARWQEPFSRWAEITPTNRLIAAYYLWPRLSAVERAAAQPSLVEALQQATVVGERSLPALACGSVVSCGAVDEGNVGGKTLVNKRATLNPGLVVVLNNPRGPFWPWPVSVRVGQHNL